jgi:hypothetical protein
VGFNRQATILVVPSEFGKYPVSGDASDARGKVIKVRISIKLSARLVIAPCRYFILASRFHIYSFRTNLVRAWSPWQPCPAGHSLFVPNKKAPASWVQDGWRDTCEGVDRRRAASVICWRMARQDRCVSADLSGVCAVPVGEFRLKLAILSGRLVSYRPGRFGYLVRP